MKILICDDSAVARKSIARSICQSAQHTICFAQDGREALSIISEQNIDILFLDLTMPVMDGFEVLAALPVSQYATKVIVVSGDIQKEARNRCLSLGAYDFVEKPFSLKVIEPLFEKLGLTLYVPQQTVKKVHTKLSQQECLAKFKELTNIALGKGAAIMADHLNEFIHLPVPNVGPLSFGELKMAMLDVLQRDGSVAVTQRFVGGGLHGEALVCLRGKDIEEIGRRLGYPREYSTYNEIVLNISNLLVSSYLVSLGGQIDKEISLRQPEVMDMSSLKNTSTPDSETMFTIEYTYQAERLDFECEVLFLLDKKSVDLIQSIMEIL